MFFAGLNNSTNVPGISSLQNNSNPPGLTPTNMPRVVKLPNQQAQPAQRKGLSLTVMMFNCSSKLVWTFLWNFSNSQSSKGCTPLKKNYFLDQYLLFFYNSVLKTNTALDFHFSNRAVIHSAFSQWMFLT